MKFLKGFERLHNYPVRQLLLKQNNSHTSSFNRCIRILDKDYERDDCTNVTPKILTYIGKNLHGRRHHPLCLTKERIVNFFYKNFIGKSGNPIFSVYDNINPVVTVKENFDSLLVPEIHPSRSKTDCYYVNKDYLLRAHCTAHQFEFILMGLDNFLIFGDAYRKDEIDATHYPVFHQADGVFTLDKEQMMSISKSNFELFENDEEETEENQKGHTIEATKFMENHLKSTLVTLMENLYGKDVVWRWVSAYFPFTHPSWELEIQLEDKWVEILGCGVIRHEIMKQAGASERIGWAFGCGLERLAMHRYGIPDIRLFWSEDTGFLSQFENACCDDQIKYKEISKHPQCINDMSFFLPSDKSYCPKDFYAIAREVSGDTLEQVYLFDEYTHPKTKKVSHTYRLVYRHMEKPLTKREVQMIHDKIGMNAARLLDITLR